MNEVRHKKTGLKAFVDVIPKEGWARGHAHPSFGMTTAFQNLTLLTSYIYMLHSRKVGVMPKEGWASIFWHDNDKDLNVCFLVTCVILRCMQERGIELYGKMT